jgi:hypothetical protein
LKYLQTPLYRRLLLDIVCPAFYPAMPQITLFQSFIFKIKQTSCISSIYIPAYCPAKVLGYKRRVTALLFGTLNTTRAANRTKSFV